MPYGVVGIKKTEIVTTLWIDEQQELSEEDWMSDQQSMKRMVEEYKWSQHVMDSRTERYSKVQEQRDGKKSMEQSFEALIRQVTVV